MDTLKLMSEVGGALFSVVSVTFVMAVTIRHFMLKDRPSRLHVAMHFLRRHEGKLAVKMPSLLAVPLPELYDYITSTWLLLCSRRWARRSKFSPILRLPNYNGNGRVRRLAPNKAHFLNPVLQWLSKENFGDWRDRAARAARDPKADPQEELFVVALVFEARSKSIRGIVVPVKVLEMILEQPDDISDDPHPNYSGAPDRPETLRVIAAAWNDWKNGCLPELAMAILEL